MSTSAQLDDSPVVVPTPTSADHSETGDGRGHGRAFLLPPRASSPAPSTQSKAGSWMSRRTLSPGPGKRDRLFALLKGTTYPEPDYDEDELPMTEEELREIFEEEEIQRFLGAFHSQVGEVTLPDGPELPLGDNGQKIVIVPAQDAKDVARAGAAPASAPVELAPPSMINEAAKLERNVDDDDSSDESDDESSDDTWVDVEKDQPHIYPGEEGLPSKARHVHSKRPPPVWGSERAAAFIVPLLPEGRAIEARNRRGGKHGKFSLSAMRIAGQRAYLSTYPFYVPFMLNLWDIARWIDWWSSARLCAIYWLLWWNNMLLPGFLFYIAYQLIKHRLMPYPTMEQLQARRNAAIEAQKFGEAFTSISSHSGQWKSSEGYSGLGSLNMGIAAATAAAQANAESMKVSGIMKMAVGAGKGALTGRFKKDKSVVDPETKRGTIEDDQVLVGTEGQEAGDWRRLAVLGIEELADAHERGKNLFLWRRPESSLMYTMVLIGAGFALAVTPAAVLAKVTYAGLGFAYWFLIPTLCAMTRKQRALIPPPLFDVPTDAEYAMEIIAKRVAMGESVTTDKKIVKGLSEAYGDRNKRDLVLNSRSPVSLNSAGTPLSPTASVQPSINTSMPAPDRSDDAVIVSPATTATDDIKDKPLPAAPGNDISLPQPEIPGEFPGYTTEGRPSSPLQTQTYSAHHKHIPGIITLSEFAIEFTPFLRSKPNVHIDLDRIRGVKKVSNKTLFVRWIEPVQDIQDGGIKTVDNPDTVAGEVPQQVIVMAEREEKFKHVGHRDEVFARIVATRKSKWVTV